MNWEQIILIVLGILLLIAGGYIRRLVKEIKEFFEVVHSALADRKISSKELALIIKEAKDIKGVISDIVKAVAK